MVTPNSYTFDFDRTCRCCLREPATYFSLNEIEFETIDAATDEMKSETLPCKTTGYLLMEFAYVQFDTNDELPQNVCDKCVTALKAALVFRRTCQESDLKLREYLGQRAADSISIKEEADEIAYKSNNNSNDHIITADLSYNESEDRAIGEFVLIKNEYETAPPEVMADIFDEAPCNRVPAPNEGRETPSPDENRKTNVCYLCSPPLTLATLEKCEEHMVEHSVGSDATLKYCCYVCGERFRWQRQKVKHIEDLGHQGGYYKYSCVQCDARFTLKKELSLHMEEHKETYPCESCDAEFKKKKARDEHMEKLDHRKEKLTCDICKAQFRLFTSLLSHMRSHEPDRHRRLCPFCGKSFMIVTRLKVHMRTHTGERPFKCDVCPKSFYSKSTRTQHMRTHLAVKPFPCTQCSKTFVEKKKLIRHTRVHTGERPFACPHCGKTFNSDVNLKAHIRIHTGETPFECDVCGEKFSQSQALLKHRRKFEHFATDDGTSRKHS